MESRPGKFIRHQSSGEAGVWEEKGFEKSTTLEHLNNRISLVLMGLKDHKVWLREIESYLNFDTRYDLKAHFDQHISSLENSIIDLSGRVEAISSNLAVYKQKLDDALKEE